MKMMCKCGQPIEFADDLAGTTLDCPSCGFNNVLVDNVTKKPKPIKVEGSPFNKEAPSKSTDRNVQERLRNLRSHTCYPFLRGIITFACGLSALAGLLTILGAVMSSTMHGDDVNISASMILGCVAGIFWIILTIAAYQAAVLFIDIADTLLAHHADLKPET